MKRLLGLMGVAVALLWTVDARAQLLPQNYMNMLFYVNGCATYSSTTSFPPQGAICVDTGTGGTYVSNGTAFVIGGSELLQAFGQTGPITAVTNFFPVTGSTAMATPETVPMETVVSPYPFTVRQISCYDSAAPGGGNSDAFTVRAGGPGPVAVGSMATTTVTCTISGATAKSCSSPLTVSSAQTAGNVIDIQDTTTGTPAARTIACVVQIDEL